MLALLRGTCSQESLQDGPSTALLTFMETPYQFEVRVEVGNSCLAFSYWQAQAPPKWTGVRDVPLHEPEEGGLPCLLQDSKEQVAFVDSPKHLVVPR